MTEKKTNRNTANTTAPASQRLRKKHPQRVGARLEPLERAKAKAAFLLSMSRRNIITEACEAAHVDYKTYLYWLEHGYVTVDELQEARQKFNDKCRGLVLNMAIDGEEEYLANNGHLVLDAQGQPIVVKRRDARLTIKFIERMLEEFKPTAQEVNVNIGEQRRGLGVFIEYELCTPNEAAYLKRLAARLDKRELGQAGTMSESMHIVEGSIG